MLSRRYAALLACVALWLLPAQATRPCLNQCGADIDPTRGKCVDGVCQCSAWYYGEDCSIPLSVPRPALRDRPGAEAELLRREHGALARFLAALGAPPQKCNGKHMRCDEKGHVIALDLGRMNLNGHISSDLGDLLQLRTLALNNNQLTGHIPRRIGRLSKLQQLMLYRNQLSGPIPSTLWRTRLQTLVLYGNKLSGPIPASLHFLKATLRYVDLSYNRLSGAIPARLTRMPYVETLFLNDNNLSGAIPVDIPFMFALKELRLDNNPRLRGSVRPLGQDGVFADETLEDMVGQRLKDGRDRRNLMH